MRTLALVTLTLSAVDHWTTYLCLRRPVEGWVVSEANPVWEWLFSRVGLVPGLLVDSALTLVAVGLLLSARVFPAGTRFAFFGAVIGVTAWAVHNNLGALTALGISPLGGPS